MYLADYHVHSTCSQDGRQTMAQAAQAAVAAGLVPVGLGPRILRCETAPLAALAVTMALTGNLQ